MPKRTTIIIFCTLFFITAKAQPSLTIATGFSANVNTDNTFETFNHIPISVQWSPDLTSSLFFKADYYIPISGNGSDDAYTLNPSLPAQATLQKNIRPYIFSVSFGWRIFLHSIQNKNSFYLDIIPLGICDQNFKVTYKNYDKANYEVLNPDVNLHNTGLVMAIGAVYKVALKNNNNLMLMVNAQTPLYAGIGDYDLSYRYVAPLQFTVGYNFYYAKRK